jgi:WhiB family redox-sensing transcriptional regulator
MQATGTVGTTFGLTRFPALPAVPDAALLSSVVTFTTNRLEPEVPGMLTGSLMDLTPQKPWANQAACRQVPGVNFFAEGKHPSGIAETEGAKAVCKRCPVRLSCLDAGLDEEWGVWGGLAAAERRRLRRLRHRSSSHNWAFVDSGRDASTQ